jgi:hypothetical protein
VTNVGEVLTGGEAASAEGCAVVLAGSFLRGRVHDTGMKTLSSRAVAWWCLTWWLIGEGGAKRG